MRRAFGVGVVLLLGLGLLLQPLSVQAQTTPTRARGQLKQNYPNPFNPETRIPFTLDASLFEGGRRVVVTLTIVSFLRQVVAYPAAMKHPQGNVLVRNLEYFSPGDHEAFWDGRGGDGRKVASGMYFAQLVVNGRAVGEPIRMVVAK
jgi:hypothetical protein